MNCFQNKPELVHEDFANGQIDPSFSRLSVRLAGVKQRDGVHFYVMRVSFGSTSWEVARRFSEFEILLQQVKEHFPASHTPKLPPKFPRALMNEERVKTRGIMLESLASIFLSHMHVSKSSEVLSFVGLLSAPVHGQEPQLSPPCVNNVHLSMASVGASVVPAELQTCAFSDAIVSVDLSHNVLTRMDGLGHLPRLRTLILDNNKLNSSRFNPPHLPMLETLWLNNNMFIDLVSLLRKLRSNMPILTYLSLMNNPSTGPLVLCTPDLRDNYRAAVSAVLPSIRFLDDGTVSDNDRLLGEQLHLGDDGIPAILGMLSQSQHVPIQRMDSNPKEHSNLGFEGNSQHVGASPTEPANVSLLSLLHSGGSIRRHKASPVKMRGSSSHPNLFSLAEDQQADEAQLAPRGLSSSYSNASHGSPRDTRVAQAMALNSAIASLDSIRRAGSATYSRSRRTSDASMEFCSQPLLNSAGLATPDRDGRSSSTAHADAIKLIIGSKVKVIRFEPNQGVKALLGAVDRATPVSGKGLEYLDSENDWITLEDDDDLTAAWRSALSTGTTLRIRVCDSIDKKTSSFGSSRSNESPGKEIVENGEGIIRNRKPPRPPTDSAPAEVNDRPTPVRPVGSKFSPPVRNRSRGPELLNVSMSPSMIPSPPSSTNASYEAHSPVVAGSPYGPSATGAASKAAFYPITNARISNDDEGSTVQASSLPLRGSGRSSLDIALQVDEASNSPITTLGELVKSDTTSGGKSRSPKSWLELSQANVVREKSQKTPQIESMTSPVTTGGLSVRPSSAAEMTSAVSQGSTPGSDSDIQAPRSISAAPLVSSRRLDIVQEDESLPPQEAEVSCDIRVKSRDDPSRERSATLGAIISPVKKQSTNQPETEQDEDYEDWLMQAKPRSVSNPSQLQPNDFTDRPTASTSASSDAISSASATVDPGHQVSEVMSTPAATKRSRILGLFGAVRKRASLASNGSSASPQQSTSSVAIEEKPFTALLEKLHRANKQLLADAVCSSDCRKSLDFFLGTLADCLDQGSRPESSFTKAFRKSLPGLSSVTSSSERGTIVKWCHKSLVQGTLGRFVEGIVMRSGVIIRKHYLHTALLRDVEATQTVSTLVLALSSLPAVTAAAATHRSSSASPSVNQQLSLTEAVQRIKDTEEARANLAGRRDDSWRINADDIQFGKCIGRGGFGEVFKSTWRGTEVAVKKLLKQDLGRRQIEEFCDEVAILRGLRHPNVVLFMGACLNPGSLAIVTEYLPRHSLFAVLHDGRMELSWSKRKRMAIDVARGMTFLHCADPPILHMDLKSLNLLVDEAFRVKVCDFGLATLKQEGASRDTMGTVHWMAPELIEHGTADEKADVYSFGVVLWEIATRKIPYDGMEPQAIQDQVLQRHLRPTPPQDIPIGWSSIMQSCWAQRPEARPSFSDLLNKLQHISDGVVK